MPLESDPLDLKIDPITGDLVVTGQGIELTNGLEAIEQLARIRLQDFQGEWFLDLDVGMPYYQEILGAKPDTAIIAARRAARSELLAIDGVEGVPLLETEFDRKVRTLNIDWRALVVFTDTEGEELEGEVSI